jgi:hypothetical protein
MSTVPSANTANNGVIAQLKAASDGLLFPSETDAAFTEFLWQGLHDITADKLLVITRNKVGTPVEEITLSHFFDGVTHEADWMAEDEIEEVRRFQDLKSAILDLLTDVRVFRVGAMDVDVYIVGKTASGECAGLSTQVVET